MESMPHKHRWFQFRLRTLLILVVVLAVPLGWLAHERQKVRERNEWLESLNKQRSRAYGVDYGDGPPIQPAWIRTLLGDDSFGDVTGLTLEANVSDADLMHLTDLKQLQRLDLGFTQVTDAGLVHLAGLTQLQWLDLDSTQVTDAGLVHLAGLTQLQRLVLNSTQVTDAGLVQLSGLTQLQALDLDSTQVTEAGEQELKRVLPYLDIYRVPQARSIAIP